MRKTYKLETENTTKALQSFQQEKKDGFTKMEEATKEKERHFGLCYKTEEELTKTLEDMESEKEKHQKMIDGKLEIARKLNHEREAMNEDERKHKEKIVELKKDMENKIMLHMTCRKVYGIEKIKRKNW